MKIYKGDIPFSKINGNQLHYPEFNHEMRENFIFEDVLKFDGYSRGRSAAYLNFIKKSDGKKVSVFLTDFVEGIVPNMIKGTVKGKFTFCKRGANFGCKRLDD